jgi:hypothetical protein
MVILWILIASIFFPANARVVKSADEAKRLEGFWDYKLEMKQFDDERMGGLKQFLKERSQYEREREKFLKSFLEEQKKQSQALSDVSKSYHEWQIEVYNREESRERARLGHIQQQIKAHEKSKKTVHVTEAEELGLASTPIRVDWRKRKFAPRDDRSGRSQFNPIPSDPSYPPPPSDPFPAQGEPEFASPPPDYFESDAPPPPYSPELYDPNSGHFAPPPPPPPPVEDFAPPPPVE